MRFFLNKKYIPHLIIIIFGSLLFFMGIANHYFFRTVTYDYGNYNFAFWDYSHFRISPMPTYPGNFLQDHFSFTLMYFIPVYWLLNWLTGTYTLIIIQYILILIAAWFTYKLVMLKTDNTWLGVGVLVYYFVLLGRYTTFSCDVNLAVISSCFIPVFLYLFEKKKYLTAFIILILSLFSRENIPLWFIFIFIVLIIQHRKDKKAIFLSITGIVVSVIYFILLFKIFIPSVETPEKQFTLFNYSALGVTPGEALMFSLKHPIETIKLFFVNHLSDPTLDRVKTEFYIVYLVSGGIILFLRPQYLIWFLPIVAQKMLNDSYIRWGISTYYSIEVVTLLPVSVFLTLSWIKSKNTQNILAIFVCIATLFMTIHKLDRTNVEIPWTLNPSKEKVYYKGFYKSPYNLKKTHELLKSIPPDAKVSASDHLFAHLAQRKSISLFPTVKDAEYIVFSLFDDYFMMSHEVNEEARNRYLSNPDWKLVTEEYPVFLLHLKKAGQISWKDKTEIPEINSDTLLCDYETIDYVNNKVLFNNNLKEAENLSRITEEKSFSKNHSIKLTMENPYSSSIIFDDIEQIAHFQINVESHGEKKKGHIVATDGGEFYMVNGETEIDQITGWKKLSISFWVPRDVNVEEFKIYLWNSGEEPVFFDNFQIIKRYKN